MTKLLSMGSWSLLYKNLKNRYDKKQISDIFDLYPIELGSWLHSLTYICNLCAHHARLWNRRFTITPISKPAYKNYLMPNYTLAAQAAMIHLMLKVISPDSRWTTRLLELHKENSVIDFTKMGFTEGWENEFFWSITL